MEKPQSSGIGLTIIHFMFPLSDESPTQWRIACMPNMKEFHSTQYHPSYQRTDSAAAVTCPACKRSDQYKRATGAK